MNNIPDGLFEDVKNYLDITWDDPATDLKLKDMIKSGMKELDDFAGVTKDYTEYGLHRTLLFTRIKYERADALDDFTKNYSDQILSLRLKEKVKRYVENKEKEQ